MEFLVQQIDTFMPFLCMCCASGEMVKEAVERMQKGEC